MANIVEVQKANRPVPVTCIDNTETIRYGFLWLKKKQQAIPGLTKDKQYFVRAIRTSVYGSMYSHVTFQYVQIVNDDGVPQLYGIERFK